MSSAIASTRSPAHCMPSSNVCTSLHTVPRAFPIRRHDVYRFDLRQGFGIARDVGGILLGAAARSVRGKLSPAELLADVLDVLPAGIFSLRHYEKFLEKYFRENALPT